MKTRCPPPKPDPNVRFRLDDGGAVRTLQGHPHGAWFYLNPQGHQTRTVRRVPLASTFPTAALALASAKHEPGFYLRDRYHSAPEGGEWRTMIEPCLLALQSDVTFRAVALESGRLMSNTVGYKTRAAARSAHVKEHREQVASARRDLKRELAKLATARGIR